MPHFGRSPCDIVSPILREKTLSTVPVQHDVAKRINKVGGKDAAAPKIRYATPLKRL